MSLFVISDTHFFHRNICKYTNRPFSSVDEMNEVLVRNWNAVVAEGDIVYHCGDFAFGSKDAAKEICGRLRGHKILVRGNHDRSRKAMLEIGFDHVYDELLICREEGNLLLRHHPVPKEKMDGFNCVAVIHGHCHNDTPLRENDWSYNVSVENIGYTPINIERLLHE